MRDRSPLIFLITTALVLLLFYLLLRHFNYQIAGVDIRFVQFDDHANGPLSRSGDVVVLGDSLHVAGSSSERDKLKRYAETPDEKLPQYLDSLKRLSTLPITDSLIRESPFLINLPINGVYPLDGFFKALESAQSNEGVVRACHYGDSQIEGDRMTYTIRALFQERFGGIGNGFIPMDDVTQPMGYVRWVTPGWQRFTVAQNVMQNNGYGPGGCAFTYFADSVVPSVTVQFFANYNTLNLAYGQGKPGAMVRSYDAVSGRLIKEASLNGEGLFNMIQVSGGGFYGKIRLVFSGPSPVIYGMWANGNRGFQMDNYGLRGQSGDGILRIQSERLRSMYAALNMKLALLQFGGNVMPVMSDTSEVKSFCDLYRQVYTHIQKAMDQGSALVISVNDLSRSVGGSFKSYPFISDMRYYQRKHAVENGLAFFDLYQFMGGKESIRYWSAAGLASKDGHFSDEGRQIVSVEIFKALLFEYEEYKKRKSA